MDKHPIDDLFRDHMTPREWPMTEDVWKEALMTIREDKQKRRRAIWLWWFAGLTVLAAIVYLYSNSNGETEQPIIATQTIPQDVEFRSPDNEPVNEGSTVAEIPVNTNQETGLSHSQNNGSVLKNESSNSAIISVVGRSSAIAQPTVDIINKQDPGSFNSGSSATIDLTRTDDQRLALLTPLEKLHSPLLRLPNGSGIKEKSFITPMIQEEFGTKILKGGLVSGFTLQSYSDIYAGLASKEGAFHDHAIRGGYQWAFNRNLGVEVRTGVRFYSGDLPVHAQVAQVNYQIGSETTTFQLQGDKLIMAGIGAAFHVGTGKHRIVFAGDLDWVFGAYGDFREQFISQESTLQDRNAKPQLISEQRSWLALKGINRWQPTGEISYRYAISPRIELGLAWLHRFNNFVAFDEIPSDRTTITIKKIF